ncbi:MAG: twin-arginine translocase subunit TatC [Armatimonadota bacterium]
MAVEAHEDFKEMELWEHLQELRVRLIRSVVYVLIGLGAAWVIYPWLQDLFFRPMRPFLGDNNRLYFDSFMGPFMLQLQVSLVAGLVLAIPGVTLEAWGFIAPGLTRTERKACYVVFPLSILFFFLGVACGYALMSVTIGYFMGYLDTSQFVLLQNPQKYLTFMVKMVVAFGVCFQMPVILSFLGWIGLVTSDFLKAQWRFAVVGCFAVAAIATPGGDPMTMIIMAAPLAILYVTSIYLVGLVEKIRERREREEAVL